MRERKSSATWEALPFLLPNMLGFLAFTFGPVFFSFGASMTNWNVMKPGQTRFVGLGNYLRLIVDGQFWSYFANTLYLMLGMPVAIAGSLWVAVLLNRRMPGIAAFRTTLYLPSFTSGVAIMILWKSLYNPDFGPINSMVRSAGFDGPNWLIATQNMLGLGVEHLGFDRKQFGLGARDALNLMGIWTAVGGNNMLLYLAALTNVPAELIEAAQLDGAGKAAVFFRVTWPQLAPTTFFIIVMSVIGGLQSGFEQARVMTGGGPAGTTTTLAYHIYSKAFEEFQMGYACAIAWVLFAFIFGWTILYWRFGNKETSY
jgi:multiple sugar transport system permease protein